jgi:hypothetical protein
MFIILPKPAFTPPQLSQLLSALLEITLALFLLYMIRPELTFNIYNYIKLYCSILLYIIDSIISIKL